ncbi:MAG: carboxymuconolactone decarboxylase family protein [Bacillota bacterium]
MLKLPIGAQALIALALDAYANSSGGVKSLARTARELGATVGEIAEALRIAYMVAGMGTLVTSRSAY